jgi:hypothetical protein
VIGVVASTTFTDVDVVGNGKDLFAGGFREHFGSLVKVALDGRQQAIQGETQLGGRQVT